MVIARGKSLQCKMFSFFKGIFWRLRGLTFFLRAGGYEDFLAGTKNFGKFLGGTKNFRKIWGGGHEIFLRIMGGVRKISVSYSFFFLLYQLQLSNDIYFYQIECIICYRILLPMGSHVVSDFKIFFNDDGE